MSQRFGKAFIKIDGDLLESMPGASLDIGGFTRNPVNGSGVVHGFSETVKEATIECEIAIGAATDLIKLRDTKDATITFECDTGQVFSIPNAWLVEPPKMTEGEGGRVPLKFVGPPADRVQ